MITIDDLVQVGKSAIKPFTKVAELIGRGTISVGKTAIDAGAGKAVVGGAKIAGDAAFRAGRSFANFAGKFIEHEPLQKVIRYDKHGKEKIETIGGGFKINKKGIAALAALGAAGNSVSATDDYLQRKMGTTTPDKYTATLSMQPPSYAMNGGATGDLVFALNANRKGGYV